MAEPLNQTVIQREAPEIEAISEDKIPEVQLSATAIEIFFSIQKCFNFC